MKRASATCAPTGAGRTQYRNAQNDYNRNLSVAGKGYISKSELDASRRSRDTAFQQVQAAKANFG